MFIENTLNLMISILNNIFIIIIFYILKSVIFDNIKTRCIS